jgi:hypothetical protein
MCVFFALPPQFDGLGDHIGVDGPQAVEDDVLGLPGRVGFRCPKRVLLKVIWE